MKEEIEKDLAHLKNKGYIPFCRKFNNQESLKEEHQLQENGLPLYFTGKLDADIVTVDLNPLYNNEDLLNYSKLEKQVTDYSSYEDFCQRFGTYKYENYDKLTDFDEKWINFFKGFGLKAPPIGDRSKTEYFARFRNSKLQLEFVPYASGEFAFENFGSEYLSKRRTMIVNEIIKIERDFIFITGSKSTVKEIFDLKDRDFLELPIKNNGHPNIGFKKINNQTLCFVSSFKGGHHISNNHKLYGKHCRKAYEEFK